MNKTNLFLNLFSVNLNKQYILEKTTNSARQAKLEGDTFYQKVNNWILSKTAPVSLSYPDLT